MRVVRTVVFLVFLSAALFASDLKIRVADSSSTAVSGAQVSVFPGGASTPAAVLGTAGEGTVLFLGLASGPYRRAGAGAGIRAADGEPDGTAGLHFSGKARGRHRF